MISKEVLGKEEEEEEKEVEVEVEVEVEKDRGTLYPARSFFLQTW